ncbi:MAG: 50S ribosomal protein L18e [Nanobdellota archaeon]
MTKNTVLQETINEFKALGKEVPFWNSIAKDLKRPTRNSREVSIGKINKNAKDGFDVVIPGKVLGTGKLDKKLTIAAMSFSENALSKIKSSGSKAVKLREYAKKNKTGKKAIIIG